MNFNVSGNGANFRQAQARRFAVILAGGDGTRLLKFTKKLTGCEIPKQFCPVLGGDPLLTVTEKRVNLKIKPEDTYYSLTKTHESFYAPLLEGVSKDRQIIQPRNRGTAPAILYSLLRLSKTNPQATVAFFPSDHYVSDDAIFMNSVEKAFRAAERKPEAIILLGIEPLAPKSSYGWIEPCREAGEEPRAEIQKVERFWEKPTTAIASELMDRGCLWNSFVMVGKVKSFLELFKTHLPGLYKLFCAASLTFGTSAERMTAGTLYSTIDDGNFSFEVLERSAENLYVLRSGGFAWSDLGEPREVMLKWAQLGLKNKLFPLAV